MLLRAKNKGKQFGFCIKRIRNGSMFNDLEEDEEIVKLLRLSVSFSL